MTQPYSLDRRTFLAGTGAMMLGAACQGPTGGASAARKIDKIGIQTYTLRNALAEDFVGTFEMIKSVGYDYVELNERNFTGRTAAALRKVLDDTGLPTPATHVGYDSIAVTPDRLADDLATLGCDYAILPWTDESLRSADGYKQQAELFNRTGETLAKTGKKFAYHNHHFEFYKMENGMTGLDILLAETDPSLVDFELDLFWAALGGVDVTALFAANPGRFKLCHIKDMTGNPADYRDSLDFATIGQTLMVNVGEGSLPFESYFAQNDVSGMEYFIAEHDNPPQPYRKSIQTSYDTIKAMRF